MKVHFKSMKCYKILVISITCLHLILPLDVAERAFSRCVATNKGKGRLKDEEEVHDHSRKLEVEFNYEFLEDFQDEQSSNKLSSGEEGPTNQKTRYKPSAETFSSSFSYMFMVIVILYPKQY